MSIALEFTGEYDVVQRNFDKLVAAIDGLSAIRIMRGNVTTAGAVGAGAGFTVSHPSTGLYTVTFTEAFESAPYVLIQTVLGGGGGVRAPLVSARSTTAFSVEIRNDGGTLSDSGFDFEVASG